MKKLSKALAFKEGLKSMAPLVASVAMGGTAIGVVAADYQNTQNEAVVEAPASTVEESLTPAQKQEIVHVLRSLRITAEDNLADDLPWVNAEIAMKLTYTLGHYVDVEASHELLDIIDNALAELTATLTPNTDNSRER